MAIFTGCEKDTIDKTTEVQQSKKISRINFSDFKSKINAKGLIQLENLFEGEQPNERTASLSTPKVLMDDIIKVQFEDYATYTFKVITGTETNEFYNLVLYINDQKEVTKSHVLKYTPSDKWLADTTQYFSGNVAIMDNTFFDENAFTDVLRGGDSCVTGVSTGWECYYGNEHAPGTCNGPIYEYTFVIEIETGTCSGGGGSTGGDFDPIGGGSGGTGDPGGDGDSLGGGSNGDNNTINTSPNVIGDIDIFLEKARAVALVLGIEEGTLEYAYLTNYNNEEEVDKIAEFINERGGNEEAKVLILDYLDIKLEMDNVKFERYEELVELIENDPWALIQDCAEQNGMDTSNYIDLYNHTIPQECQNRLDGLGSEYNNQSISEGNVPLANIDYYGVEVTNYPDFDNDGNPDTETEIYQAFREKFTDLASGEKENFESECNVPFDLDNIIDIWWQFNPMSSYDSNLFLSNNPISSIILIDAGANNPFVNTNADLGAIIVSDFSSNNWTISTIQTPSTETQPFSGNRQWGWLINQNGNLEFYTRAIDVARVADIFLEWPATWIGSDIECQQDTYYDIAEATWQNLQDEIKEWIENEGGGQATVNSPKVARISKNKIVEILTTNESIEQILSSCD